MKGLAWTRGMNTGARPSMEMIACVRRTRTELQVMISGLRSHHNECMKSWTKYTRCHFINLVQRLFDEDINTIVTPTAPAAIHTGPITRARARQLNYQVLSFLSDNTNVHENMMLPNLDTFVLLTNEWPSMDK